MGFVVGCGACAHARARKRLESFADPDRCVNAPRVQGGRCEYVPELITNGIYGGAATARYMRVCGAYLDGARQMN